MNFFYQAIRLEELKLGAGCWSDDRAVVTGAQNYSTITGEKGQEPGDETIFAELATANPFRPGLAQLHCRMTSGNASAVNVKALKSACIVIGTRMEPLHS